MPRRGFPWSRPHPPQISREGARDLVNHPPALPDPFEYGAGHDRLIASTREKEPTDIWREQFLPKKYPATELFQTTDQLAAWQDVLALDLIYCTQDRDDNVSVLSGLYTGLMLGVVPSGLTWAFGKEHTDRMLGKWITLGTIACVFLMVLLAVKVPYRRLDRLRLIEVAYRKKQRELEHDEAWKDKRRRKG